MARQTKSTKAHLKLTKKSLKKLISKRKVPKSAKTPVVCGKDLWKRRF